MKLMLRTLYLNRIEPYIGTKSIKILVGMRRCGKTVLLSQLREKIRSEGISSRSLIYINFESCKFEKLSATQALYDYIVEKIQTALPEPTAPSPSPGPSKTQVSDKACEKIYLFFDEIQKMEGWQTVISALHADFNCDIYLAGSDSRLLSPGENDENFEGVGKQSLLLDAVIFYIYPFKLSEICEFYDANQLPYTREHIFVDYLKYGGLPTRLMLPNEHSVATYLEDVYHSILVKDIFAANSIRNSNLLKGLIEFLFDHMGTPFSARSIHRALKESGHKMTVETVLQYLHNLQEGLLFSRAGRWDIKADTLLASSEKYYACDIGLRNSVRTMENIDYNKLFENIVYLEMRSRGYNVKAGKLGGYDIDFVCTKDGEKIYIQVAYLIILDQIGREFGSLEKIKDHYPKYVISNDMVDMSRNGIRHLNIMDFLLE